MEPPVLLLDEPTAGLDPVSAASVRRVVTEVVEREGLTTVVVEHLLEPWLPFASRIVVLDDGGRIIADGEPPQVLAEHGARLDTDALAPWVRWITPRRPSVMNKRFDTRFFLAAVPPAQEARHDDFEVTEARWLTPRQALQQYRAHEIEMAPPQIVSLLHLMQYRDVAQAMQDARSRTPPLIEPQPADTAETRVLCYPGDEAHSVPARALPEPVPTRVVWRNKRFEPPQGFGPYLD